MLRYIFGEQHSEWDLWTYFILRLIHQKVFLTQEQFIVAPYSTSGEDAANMQCLWHRRAMCASLGLCGGLEAVPICTYRSEERQGQLCPSTAAELLLQAASGSQCMNRQCCVPFKSNTLERISSWVKKNYARDTKTIKSLKKAAFGNQKWNTKLYGEGKSKQLAAIVKTPVRNF